MQISIREEGTLYNLRKISVESNAFCVAVKLLKLSYYKSIISHIQCQQ